MLRLLITNHQLRDYSGSDVFSFTLADFLKRRGHSVTVYSRYLGKVASELTSIGIRVVDDLIDIRDEVFDIAHVHHNINAIETRYYFPDTPILFLSHGVLPFLEKPPVFDINIGHFAAVSEEVSLHLAASEGIDSQKISIFRNIIDSQKFHPIETIHEKPQKALVLSNNIDKEHEDIVKGACESLGIECKFIGQRFGIVKQDQLPFEINGVDIVFSLGRGIIETMLCGRIPIVYDYRGGDGIVTPDNFHDLKKYNFSGRRYNRQFSVEEFKDEINRYKPSSALELRKLALDEYAADSRIDDLITIYNRIIENPLKKELPNRELIEYFVLSLRETRRFFDVVSDKTVMQIKDTFIENLHSGSGWKLLLRYYAVKDYVRKWLKNWGQFVVKVKRVVRKP